MIYPNPRQKINDGHDYNFFYEGSIAPGSAFADNATVHINLRGPSFNFYLRNLGGGTIVYSFNGNVIHGKLTAAQAERLFTNRAVSKIWLYAESTPANIEVECWTVA